MSICVISQPRFFPGLHYLHRMMVADVFVILDTVQFNPRHEENRAKLKGPNGLAWLTVPTVQGSRAQTIRETRLATDGTWASKAMRMLQGFYGKSPHYKAFAAEVGAILEQPFHDLASLNWASWQLALKHLEVSCKFVRASDLPVTSKGSELLLVICKHLHCDKYISGGFGKQYLDLNEFRREGIAVNFHEYAYPAYQQRFGDFVPFVSYLDMLFNDGLSRVKIRSGGTVVESAS